MKTDSAIMTKLSHNSNILRVMTDDESRAVKAILVEMLTDLYELCNTHNLDLILVGGSALGAVRHKGFIPWDDDLDVGLSRQDYDKLISLIEQGSLGDKYDFSYPNKNKDSKNLFLKIFKKNTVYTELHDVSSDFPKGIYIDVFPIEFAPSSNLQCKVKGLLSDILSFISVSVLFFQYPSDVFRDFMSNDPEAYKRYKLRLVIGRLASYFGDHKLWVNRFEKFAQSKRKSNLMTIPTGRKHYYGEILPADIFFPSSKGTFEGIEIKLPHKSKEYLSNLYGDFMAIPPVEKRERHYIIELEF